MEKNTLIKYLFVSFLIALPTLFAASQNKIQLKLITFNIKSFEGNSGDMSKAFIIKPFADLLAQYDPDVIFLNEVENLTSRMMVNGKYRDVVEELASMLGMYGIFGYSYAIENKDGTNKDESKYTYWENEMYGNAILSKYPIMNSNSFLLPRPTGSADQRSVLETDILLPSNVMVRMAVTHLDHTGGRYEQCQKLISDKIIKGSLPTVLAGDMNDFIGSKVINTLTTYYDRLDNDDMTYPGGDSKIDYIFGYPKNAWKVIETKVLSNGDLSDHKPVMSIIEYVK